MKFLSLVFVSVFSFSAFAGTTAFKNIDSSDMSTITKAMGSNFIHSSMMPASRLGTLIGFQIGVVAAQTGVPKFNTFVKASGGSSTPNLYNGGIVGALGIPFGISFEGVVIPAVTSNGAKASAHSYALKWNIDDVIPVLPVNLALRAFSSNAEFSFDQTVATQAASLKNTTDITGLQLLFSPKLPIIDPIS